MGQITTLFVRKVLGEVDSDIDKNAWVQSMGIELNRPVYMISDAHYYSFFEGAAAIDRNGTTLPLRAGAAMRSDDYGAFGLAWKSATTLRGSYNRAERYARVLTSVSTYEVEATNEGAYMHLHRSGERHLGMRLSNEATIASILSISQEVSTEAVHPMAVYFKHAAPGSIADHETYFGCPVHFDSDRDALLFSNESLQAPNKLGDESISKFFQSHLETELSKLEDDTVLDQQIRQHVTQSLSEGIPMLSDVAHHFGMSGRTLQRRLSELGYSYQTLVDEARRQLAERLLRETDFSPVEIAFMTGFSEQSAFARAFKRWAGQTPRNFRIHHQL
ncbi:MAG: AraC family transcriptional regulator ligand-binding domain-containing protein [Anaerolineae bacterium]|nr:AraC family transcriptional regulator ligand-binding domain-containing protein [Anaerolineae bacterium]